MSEASVPPALDRMETFAGRSRDVLRAMILDGSLPSGQRINEVQLSQSLGISRGPLREAIRHLASEGLVEMVTHRGAYVRSFTARELSDLYELRIALETHAVRLVAVRGSAAEIERLAATLGATDEVMAAGQARAYPSELDFHEQLVALSGNEALLQAAVQVAHQIRLARARSAQQPDRARDALLEHHAILDAVAARRPGQAAELMQEHIARSLQNATGLLAAGMQPEAD